MVKAEKSAPREGRYKVATGYLSDSLAELKKVQAPTRQEAWQHTIQALFLIVFFSIILAVMDGLFQWITGWIFNFGSRPL